MDYNLLSIIKKEKERLLEDKNNYSRLSCDVHKEYSTLYREDVLLWKVENGFDDCLQNSVLSNNQQETFNYDNFKEEKQSCSICSENFINSYSLYKHNLIHLKVPLVRRKLFICGVCSNFYTTKKQLQNHITTAHEDKTLYNRTNSLKSLYKCGVCKKVLKYKTWFNHKKNCHEQTKVQCDIHECVKPPRRTYQCPKCPKILKSSMTVHLKNCHSVGTFQCEICNSVLKSKHYLLVHMQTVHDDNGMLHHCDICGKSFKSQSKVRRHKKLCHQKPVQCPKCPKILNKISLKSHLKNCHSEGKFQCKICKSVFKSKPYLLVHMRKVHDEDGMLHHCDICGKSFKSPSKVKRHKDLLHREGMTVQCPKCPKTLNKKYLKLHLEIFHSEGTFQCKICKSVFKCQRYLLVHMRKVHDDDGMLHHCDICGKSFKSLSKVKIHKKRVHIYQVGVTVQCPKCPKILKCKSSLTVHIKSCHIEGTFQCKICKSVFKTKRYLFNHMRRVHDDDGRLHHCDICGKSFKSPSKVRRHKELCHQTTVQCPKCPKILNKSYLNSHLEIVHSEVTFQCNICKSVFKSKPYLLAHMRRVHDDDGMLHHCDICGKSFKSPSKVKRHKDLLHQEGMTVQCPKCPKILNKISLKSHLKNCHSEGPFQCKDCKSVFKSEAYLLAHMRRMHDDDGMLHHCDICGKSFKCPRRVRRHKKNSHT